MTHKTIIFLFLSSLFFIACDSKKPQEEVMIVKASNLVKETIKVKGMTCVGCETRVEKSVAKLEGVVAFKAVHENNTATIEFDKSKTDLKTIEIALEKIGAKTCL
jgi:copper chaperone CopZ